MYIVSKRSQSGLLGCRFSHWLYAVGRLLPSRARAQRLMTCGGWREYLPWPNYHVYAPAKVAAPPFNFKLTAYKAEWSMDSRRSTKITNETRERESVCIILQKLEKLVAIFCHTYTGNWAKWRQICSLLGISPGKFKCFLTVEMAFVINHTDWSTIQVSPIHEISINIVIIWLRTYLLLDFCFEF